MQPCSGFTFIEILVSMLLFSLLLLGFDGLQWRVMQETRVHWTLVQAEQQAQALLLHYRYHPDAVVLEEARHEIAHSLPQGQLITNEANSLTPVVIAWGGMQARDCIATKLDRAGCLIVDR